MRTVVRKAAPREPELIPAVDGILTWLPGVPRADRRKAVGACPHKCSHAGFKKVAAGPDKEHRYLVVCLEPSGCNGQCRGWLEDNSTPWSRNRMKYALLEPLKT